MPTQPKPTELLIATYNPGKLHELSALLSDVPLKLKNLSNLKNINEVEETGLTIRENAELKAAAYAGQTGLWSLADDSGLEVTALNGAPGVYSDRYAGKGASDHTKMNKVLTELAAIHNASRAARFFCVMSIADNTEKIVFTAEGICSGTIASEPRGSNGFGYDPIFIPDGFDKTFGELSGDVKQQISHRARAVAEIIRFLHAFFKL